MLAKDNSPVPTVEGIQLVTAWIVMDIYSPITAMGFVTIESCLTQMQTMAIMTTITRFCGLICEFFCLSNQSLFYLLACVENYFLPFSLINVLLLLDTSHTTCVQFDNLQLHFQCRHNRLVPHRWYCYRLWSWWRRNLCAHGYPLATFSSKA